MGSVAAGVFLFAAASFQQIGLLYTSSANSGFITGFYILFVPVIGMFFGHTASKSLWAAILVCLVGFYLLSVSEGFVVSKGDLLTVICAVLWACQILVIDHVAGKGDAIQIAFLQFAICAVLSLAAGLLFENCTFYQIQAAWGAIAYAGIMSVGIAFTMQVVCQKRCSPGPAAILMSLEAVFAALAGYLVLNQTLTSRAMVGCGLILCGVLIVQLAPMRRNLKAATQPLQPEANELHADNRRISVLALACHDASNDSAWGDKGEFVEPLRRVLQSRLASESCVQANEETRRQNDG